jgi:hypothetical protein
VDLPQILQQFITQRDRLNAVIENIQALNPNTVGQLTSKATASQPAPSTTGKATAGKTRPVMTPEIRKKISDTLRARWVAQHPAKPSSTAKPTTKAKPQPKPYKPSAAALRKMSEGSKAMWARKRAEAAKKAGQSGTGGAKAASGTARKTAA